MRKSTTLWLGAAAGLSLCACTTIVENRVETALADAGVPAGVAECMAPRWANRLSINQIRGIQQFANNVRAEGEQLTVSRLVSHARSWNDPRALLVVTASAARCAFH